MLGVTDAPIGARRAPWQYALSGLFALAIAADLSLVLPFVFFGARSEPAGIVVWHVVTCGAAVASLIAIWQRRAWAPYAVAARGVANSTLVLSVPFFVDVPADAVAGIRMGAAVVAVFAALCTWVAWRLVRPPTA